jgi:diaminopimelate epimerase
MDLKAFCERLAAADLFPHGINVEVLRELSGENCRVFFHERGVGPTESSSTGSAAVFAVLRKLGRVGDHMSISSGNHQISVFAVGDRIYVENHAEIVYKGVFLSTGEK